MAVLLGGARCSTPSTLTIGTLIAFIGVLSLLFQPLHELSELYGQVQSASAAMEKIAHGARRRARTSPTGPARARSGASTAASTSTT